MVKAYEVLERQIAIAYGILPSVGEQAGDYGQACFPRELSTGPR